MDEYDKLLEKRKVEIQNIIRSYAIGGIDKCYLEMRYVREEYFESICDDIIKLIYKKE